MVSSPQMLGIFQGYATPPCYVDYPRRYVGFAALNVRPKIPCPMLNLIPLLYAIFDNCAVLAEPTLLLLEYEYTKAALRNSTIQIPPLLLRSV
jgi:hypothetical protein